MAVQRSASASSPTSSWCRRLKGFRTAWTRCWSARWRWSAVSSEDPRVLKRPPPNLHFAHDVLLRDRSPVAAVGAVVAMVAHDEVVALLNDLWTPIVVAAEFRRDVLVVQRNVVHVDATVHNAHRVALFGDDALDEHLLGIERVVEHHDVAGPRLADLIDH